MCDIYMHKCNASGCKTKIDMHLMDFSTDSTEIKVFCQRHIPKSKRVLKNGIVWGYSDRKRGPTQRCFVQALTRNAHRNADGNHPNAFRLRMHMEWGVKVNKDHGEEF